MRRTIAGARLMAGMIFRSLPPDCVLVVHDGASYYLCEGSSYFTRVVYRGRVSWRVVRPPLGVTVTVLHPSHTTVVVAGRTYFVLDDVYYVRRRAGYVVVVKP